MKRFLIALFVFHITLGACSEPECGSDEILVGTRCQPIRRRADGAVPDDDRGASGRKGADAAMGGIDARVEAASDAASDSDDAADPNASAPASGGPGATVAAPVCGDGLLNGTEQCDAKIAPGQPGSCPTADSCKSGNPCLLGRLAGDALACTARCEVVSITSCIRDDHCCPPSCASGTDDDCSATCGNGFVDSAAGETCEPNTATPCKTSCDDGNACTKDTPTGSAMNCNFACTNTPITAPAAGDGCCPPGANATNDSDCTPKCDNGVVEHGEKCDGNCPSSCSSSDPCKRSTLQGTGCARECVVTAVTEKAVDGCCVAGETATSDPACPGCGNGRIDPGEQCDDRNTIVDDGCDETCHATDISSTPGDDRKDWMRCNALSACPRPSSCVRRSAGYSCESSVSGDYLGSARCDGPEDCASNEYCLTNDDSYDAICQLKTSSGINDPRVPSPTIYCHVASTCPLANQECKPSTNGYPSFGSCRTIGI